MASVDEYLAGLPADSERSELERMHTIIQSSIPECAQGTSYGMACYLYRGKPVAALVATKHHLSWYPYSGQVLDGIPAVAGYSHTKAALHFSADQPLTDSLVAALLGVRMRQIDRSLDLPQSGR